MVFEGLKAAKLLENVVSGAFSTFWKNRKTQKTENLKNAKTRKISKNPNDLNSDKS